MGVPRDLIREYPGLGAWSVLMCFRGSIAHGTYQVPKDPTSTDDKDVLSICVPPPRFTMTLMSYGGRGTREIKRDEWDIVIYDIRKALNLLSQGNPNILQVLWTHPRHHLNVTPAGDLLLSNTHLFTGKHVYKPFTGYARAQLNKMERGAYQGYMGEKRKALVDQFGYDTKKAAHLVRLLRTGIEFLSTGYMNVERSDARELLAIKRGEWKIERVQKEADRLFAKIEDALIHSKLPEWPDRENINRLCFEMTKLAWMDQCVWPPELTKEPLTHVGGQLVGRGGR